jgi:malonyl-CoA O-methyltransferase
MDIQNAYNQWSAIYDTNENLTRDLDAQILRETLHGQRFHSTLELGCGTGKNTVFLAEIAERVHALDFSEGMLEKARLKLTTDNVRFSMADLTLRWPCEDAAHDLIVCDLVLEHIKDLNHIFAEAARTLRPRGWFFINELHPFKQYGGTKARYEQAGRTVEVEAYVHHISEVIAAGQGNGLRLRSFREYWHAADAGKPPRIASFVFINE